MMENEIDEFISQLLSYISEFDVSETDNDDSDLDNMNELLYGLYQKCRNRK